MRISDWSSDVCSSDLRGGIVVAPLGAALVDIDGAVALHDTLDCGNPAVVLQRYGDDGRSAAGRFGITTGMLARSVAEDLVKETADLVGHCCVRSEEHTSEPQSLMRISYAVFCLKKKKQNQTHTKNNNTPTTKK